ncbi:S1C family serine protease [Ferroacidibacillus organovorans]|nr:trypsin-like peptidase domain-containing protein [Ferroacidibacillus organovorans]
MQRKKGTLSNAAKGLRARTARNVRMPDFVSIVDQCKDAVVNIEVAHERARNRQIRSPFGLPFDMFIEQEPRAMNIGTGFIFDDRGYILTNEHVIHGASRVHVKMRNQERKLIAHVVGTNYEHDLAVLKIDLPKTIRVLRLGKSKDVQVGEWVMAVGNPLGLDHSVTVGIISAKERPMQIGDRSYPHLLQTDAAINRGNSGGPLISLRGEVIGINTAVSQSSQGIGFAIAIDVVRNALPEMMGKKYRQSV